MIVFPIDVFKCRYVFKYRVQWCTWNTTWLITIIKIEFVSETCSWHLSKLQSSPLINLLICWEQGSRKKLSILVQIITGHNFLKRIVHEKDENKCHLCLEDQQISFHIMAKCPALAEPSLRVFGTPFLYQPSLRWSSREIASFIHEASIGHFLDPNEALGPGHQSRSIFLKRLRKGIEAHCGQAVEALALSIAASWPQQ